jgi:tetratricopeptide (TPR) repeat protein
MKVPDWVKPTWATAIATATLSSAVWGFILKQTIALKDEQLKALQARAAIGALAEGLPRRVDQLEARVSFFQRMLQVDPVDGRWALGGVSGGSDLTNLVVDAEARSNARDFDGALDLARRMEEILPDFAGAEVIRFDVDKGKGYEEAAVEHARKAVNRAPNDRRLLPLYAYLTNYWLKQNDKRAAEEFARQALKLAPEDKVLAEQFKNVFGFLPSASTAR